MTELALVTRRSRLRLPADFLFFGVSKTKRFREGWPLQRGPHFMEPNETVGETVVVLEDVPFVKNPICATLRAYGYRVLEATTAAEAIEVSRRHNEPISLLVADVFLPNKSGVWAAVEVLKISSRIRVLFMSGTPLKDWPLQDLSALRASPPSVWRFLQKPFPAPVLARSVRELLEGKVTQTSSSDFGDLGAN